jgi:hypothetical protein
MGEIRKHDGGQQQAGRKSRVIDDQAPKEANTDAALLAPAVSVPFSGYWITFRQRYRHGKTPPVTATESAFTLITDWRKGNYTYESNA